jgi:RNA polymerase sigma factor (sigma-70 family)
VIDNDDPIWVEVFTIATYAVRPVANRYRGFVTHDDLVQTVIEYAIKRPDKIEEYLVREDETERRRGAKALSVMFRRSAERHARKEKATALGYEVSDEFFYQPDLVENLIRIKTLGYDSAGQVLRLEDVGGKRSKSLPNEGGNLLAMVSDVDHALSMLEPRLRYILEARYGQGETLQVIADDLEVSVQRIDQLSRSAMRKVIEFLGGESPY